MKMLTGEITKLLDKLYNLRGEDSEILKKMDVESSEAEATRERSEAKKTTLKDKIEELQKEESVLVSEGEKLVEALSRIKNEDFKFVLEKLNIDFDPEKLNVEINKLLPSTIEKVGKEAEVAKEELASVEQEMDSAIATIEELKIRKDEAIANQERLNEYFALALGGNINITRDSITSLLAQFNFTDDEQREAAKLLMFPEDGLYEYDNKIKETENLGMSISEVFAEAKEASEEVNNEEVVDDNEELEQSTNEVSEEAVDTALVVEEKLSPKEELIKLLSDIELDYLDFTNNDIDKILDNYDKKVLIDNVEYAKEKDIKLDLFVDSAELLYDKEFREKANKLIEIGKEPFDIYLNPSVLIKYNKEELENVINNLKEEGLDPKKVPLIAY